MILSWIKNISLLCIVSIMASSPTLASDRLNGLNIKEQAANYFSQQGLNLSLLVSDKRSFFPCSVPLDFRQRQDNDWSTVLVRCSHENWETFIRSANLFPKIASSKSPSIDSRLTVAILIRNISKGQVISEEYLGFEDRPERQIHGAYNKKTIETGLICSMEACWHQKSSTKEVPKLDPKQSLQFKQLRSGF